MIRVEKHIINNTHKFYEEMDKVSFLSKNLYNSTLYSIRQHFFDNKEFISYSKLNKIFGDSNQVDYRALPSKVSQQTMKMVEQNFKSFFKLLKMKSNSNFDKKISIPKYLDKLNGRYLVIYTNQAISKTALKRGYINPSGTNIYIKTKCKDVQQVRIVPRPNYYVVEVVYTIDDIETKQCNGRYASIDLGINNLATVGSNVIKPIILNGKPIKSINQFYNKRKAKLVSILETNSKTKGKYVSKKIIKLTNKRNNKINDYLHKASRYLVNHLVENNINTLIIGKNINWKQDINIGKVNNQKFVSIPFNKFIDMIIYKCNEVGINIILTEESYTSKCSFFDNEKLGKSDNYLGKRTKRGLFVSKNKRIINADLNGSLNILRKVVGDFQYSIEVCSTPLKITL